jgi:hypothetical protein
VALDKQKMPEKRATEIVEALEREIQEYNEGEGGMPLRKWQARAREEIAAAIREIQLMTTLRETMRMDRWGKVVMRIAFMLLAASFSFLAFWMGVVYIGQAYGFGWGAAAAGSAALLSIMFVIVGLSFDID